MSIHRQTAVIHGPNSEIRSYWKPREAQAGLECPRNTADPAKQSANNKEMVHVHVKQSTGTSQYHEKFPMTPR